MRDERASAAPDSTAVRVALWRALHVQIDPPPHALEDEIGLRLAAPDESWRNRPDMNPQFTRVLRSWIVARARFLEDLVVEEASRGVRQYVLLGPASIASRSAGRKSPAASEFSRWIVTSLTA
jgi:O-methyltransferase involved in polyketide biosynthesis